MLWLWVIVGLLGLTVLGVISRWLLDNPRREVEYGVGLRLLELYALVVHRVRVLGGEHRPRGTGVGPLIVVANHTAGVDPILVQCVCPFEVRWLMARDMMVASAEAIWRWLAVIPVSRSARDAGGTREALRHLEAGGVIGIFPEGGIERPPQTIVPFLGGVGLLIKRSGARVLPIVIRGTPQVDPAWASLRTPSRSTLEFKPSIDYTGSGMSAEEIALDLRRRYLEWTGWPANDNPAQPVGYGVPVR